MYSVPLATEPGISLIILTPMKILLQNYLGANVGHFQHMLWCHHISYTFLAISSLVVKLLKKCRVR